MKNIFNYATKELSQDAFLMWLISNYDEKHDDKLRNTSIEFLRFLTGNKLSKEVLSNSLIKVHPQLDHIDITVKIYKGKSSSKYDAIVIEDKVYSSEHRQLKKYNESIDKWPNVENVYKVFYKIGDITEDDKNGVQEANKGSDSKWQIFSLETIYDFFKNKKDTNSQLLNDYIDYVEETKKALDGKGTKDFLLWKKSDWIGFAKMNLENYNRENSPKEEYVWVGSYQNKYFSVCYQRRLSNSSDKDSAVLEMFIRNGNSLSANFHHAFTDSTENRKWSVEKCVLSKSDKDKKEILRNKLRDYIKNMSKTEEFKDVQVTRDNAANCFGRIKNKFIVKDKEGALNQMLEWIEHFNRLIDGFKE